MSGITLRRVEPAEAGNASARVDPIDDATIEIARTILHDVRDRGEEGLRHHAERLGDIAEGGPLYAGPAEFEAALASIDAEHRVALEHAADRIRSFAEGQRAALRDFDTPAPGGGRMGHTLEPVERAGCYAPGGRYPLPSSVLMTAATARAAGVSEVWVTCPNAHPAMLAAASLAGATGALLCGGAQAIAAFTHGAGPIQPCDAIVGPGNRFVTAAKQLVAGRVAIDMLAGPSEVLVLTDGIGADPAALSATIAADMLAQAEHDDDAAAILVTTDVALVGRVEAELAAQLETLPTAATARTALDRGSYAVVCGSLDEAIAVTNRIAPEHLEILTADPASTAERITHAGALFIGHGAAEAIGDYGLGPNHTLPTSGSARSFGGLSVANFLRVRTYIDYSGAAKDTAAPPEEIITQTAALARVEGLEAHARSAERRLT